MKRTSIRNFALALSILMSFSANAGTEQSSQKLTGEKEVSTIPESLNACVGKNEGDSCAFNINNEKSVGTCKKSSEGKMNCTIAKK
jgi:hypothetical protein